MGRAPHLDRGLGVVHEQPSRSPRSPLCSLALGRGRRRLGVAVLPRGGRRGRRAAGPFSASALDSTSPSACAGCSSPVRPLGRFRGRSDRPRRHCGDGPSVGVPRPEHAALFRARRHRSAATSRRPVPRRHGGGAATGCRSRDAPRRPSAESRHRQRHDDRRIVATVRHALPVLALCFALSACGGESPCPGPPCGPPPGTTCIQTACAPWDLHFCLAQCSYACTAGAQLVAFFLVRDGTWTPGTEETVYYPAGCP